MDQSSGPNHQSSHEKFKTISIYISILVQVRASEGDTGKAFEVCRFTCTATKICSHLTEHKYVNKRAGSFPLTCLQHYTADNLTTEALLPLDLSVGD